jgi:hypothetical protein
LEVLVLGLELEDVLSGLGSLLEKVLDLGFELNLREKFGFYLVVDLLELLYLHFFGPDSLFKTFNDLVLFSILIVEVVGSLVVAVDLFH